MKCVHMSQVVAKQVLDSPMLPDKNNLLVVEISKHPALKNMFKTAKVLDKIFDVKGMAKIILANSRHKAMKDNPKYNIVREEDGYFVGFTSIDNWGKFYRTIRNES